MPKTEAERRAFLIECGLNPDADALDVMPARPQTATPIQTAGASTTLAPAGVDPHTMPVTDIEFDPSLLDNFPDLGGQGMRAASDYVFSLYKSPGRNKDRNSLLHSRIGKFISQTRRSRETGGFVREAVKTTKEQRDLAAVLATAGMTAGELAALIENAKEKA